MDEFVSDAAYGRFMRTTNPFLDPCRLSYPHNLTRSLPEGITRKELGIISLTAQFMAVYGIFFQRALIKRVINDPRFEFMTKPPDDCDQASYYRLLAGYVPSDTSRFSFYCRLFCGFMAVSKTCQELTKNAGATADTVLEVFFHLIARLEKQEDGGGVDKSGVFDLHVLEFLSKMLGQRMPFPPGYLVNMLQPWRSQVADLLTTDKPDSHDRITALEIEMNDISSRRSWRSSVSYHACLQQMEILRQDHAFCQQLPPSPPPMDPAPSLWVDLPPPKFTTLIPQGITPKELGVIKVTAQFDAVYGLYFRDCLEKKVNVDTRFSFLKPADSRHSFFSQLSLGYDRALLPSPKKGEALVPLRMLSGSPSLETLLQGFWSFVEMVEKGVDMCMLDLHTFEFFANTENQELNLPPRYLPMMMYPLVPPFTHLQVRVPPCQLS